MGTAEVGLSERAVPFRLATHGLIYIVGALGWVFDAYDVLLPAFVIPLIAASWHLTSAQLGAFGSAGFLGMAIGAALWGSIADVTGRRTAFMVTLLIYGVFTVGDALAQNLSQLMVFRFLAGIGLGGCIPVDYLIVAEFMPDRVRGRLLTFLENAWVIGVVLVGVVSIALAPYHNFRLLFLASAIPSLLVFAVRWFIPESPLFLMKRGRVAEANRVLRAVHGPGFPELRPQDLPPEVRLSLAEKVRGVVGSLARIWRFNWKWTLMSWYAISTILFGYYGVMIWLPRLLIQLGYKTVAAFAATTIVTIFAAAGVILGTWLVEIVGRKAIIVVGGLMMGLSTLVFAYVVHNQTAAIWALGMFNFFEYAAYIVLLCFIQEIYPTEIRGAGGGWASTCSRVISAWAPATMGALYAAIGLPSTMWILLAALVVAVGIVLWAGPETRGKSLA